MKHFLQCALNWPDAVTNTYFCFKYFCSISDDLEKEARMHMLKHENIVALLATISETGHYGIVMEYLLHGSLDDYIYIYDVRVVAYVVCTSISGLYVCVCVYWCVYSQRRQWQIASETLWGRKMKNILHINYVSHCVLHRHVYTEFFCIIAKHEKYIKLPKRI